MVVEITKGETMTASTQGVKTLLHPKTDVL